MSRYCIKLSISLRLLAHQGEQCVPFGANSLFVTAAFCVDIVVKA